VVSTDTKMGSFATNIRDTTFGWVISSMPATSSLDGVRPTRQIVANHAASATWSQVRRWQPPRRLQPDRVFGMAYDWDGLFS
jgi:hypothetical protein